MGEEEATFEVWRRGEMVESFTGPRATAKAQAEARLHGYKMSDLAFVKEVTAEETQEAASRGWTWRGVLNVLIVLAAAFLGFWAEF